MAPRLKRSRTSSSSNETITIDVEAPPKLKQHESLWFEDGNIVLATDVHLYSVHRGVLARNSTVFKDMLELPNVGSTSNLEAEGIANRDTWEGKPLVRMVGDSDEDVYHILMAIYDTKFYYPWKPSHLSVVLSLLRMGTKYNFSDVLDAITKHLEGIYPSDLEHMKKRAINSLLVDCYFGEDDSDFQLLVAAEHCNAKSLLPMLHFDCATFSLKYIIDTSEALAIEKPTFLRILRGREQISKYLSQFAAKAYLPHRKCSPSCTASRLALIANFINDPPQFPINTLLEKGHDDDNKDILSSVCDDCSEACTASLEAYRKEIWDSIPGIFELGTWEDVTPKVLDDPSPSIADGMEQAP